MKASGPPPAPAPVPCRGATGLASFVGAECDATRRARRSNQVVRTGPSASFTTRSTLRLLISSQEFY